MSCLRNTISNIVNSQNIGKQEVPSSIPASGKLFCPLPNFTIRLGELEKVHVRWCLIDPWTFFVIL